MKVCFKGANDFFNEEEIDVIKNFTKFLQNEMSLNKDVKVIFLSQRKGNMTTGMRKSHHLIYILSKNRLLIDILRTYSHEWVHEFQHQKLGLKEKQKIKNIGGPEENMANVLSGIMIKKFDKENPKYEKIIYKEV